MKSIAVLLMSGFGLYFLYLFSRAWLKWRRDVKRWNEEQLEKKVAEQRESEEMHRRFREAFWADLDRASEIRKKERALYKKKIQDSDLQELMSKKFDASLMSPAEYSKILHEKMVSAPGITHGSPKTEEEVPKPKMRERKETPTPLRREKEEVITPKKIEVIEPERFCGTCKVFKPGMRYCQEPWYPRHKRIDPETPACAHWKERTIKLPERMPS